MKCMYCHGEMKKSTALFQIDRQGVNVRLDEVPVWGYACNVANPILKSRKLILCRVL